MSELTMHQFVNRLEVHKDDVDDIYKIMFKGEDWDVFNPWMSTCSRFQVHPEIYDLTVHQAMLLSSVNQQLIQANKVIEFTSQQCLDAISDLDPNRSFWTLDSFEQAKSVEGLNLIGYAMAAFALDSLAKQYA